MDTNTKERWIIIGGIITWIAMTFAAMLADGCAAELPNEVTRSPEDRTKNFIRLFTDPNMAPMLRRINDARIDKQIEELDRERALKTM